MATNTLLRARNAQRQLRSFVLVWTFITLVMGLATFMAIYFTYSSPNAPRDDENLNVALSQPLMIPSQTPLPVTPSPTVEAQVVAQFVTPTPSVPAPEAASPTPLPTLAPAFDDRFEVGIQVQFSLDFNPVNQDGFYRSVRNDLGMEWVKTQVRWRDFEPRPNEYNWAILDLVMPSAQRFGIKQALSIVTAPDWAREPGADLSKQGPPANIQDYVDFVLKVIERYPGQVAAIEVWNEMNIDREWASPNGLSAQNYVALLRATYNAVKAVDPGILIITGALSPTGWDDGVSAINDFRYTDMLIQAGVLNYADCYGAHANGYNLPPLVRWDEGYNDPTAQFRGPFDNPHHSWSFRSTLEGYANRIRAAGSQMKLCVTEFGWAVAEDLEGYPQGFEFAKDNTLAEQAEWFPQALSFMEESGFTRLAIVWNFNYGPQAGYNPDNDNVPYSLIGPGYTFRPAYDAIGEWVFDYNRRTGRQ
ncbi:MAG: hypothetical protein SNJ54_11750 [Anaerolineae bacterium]